MMVKAMVVVSLAVALGISCFLLGAVGALLGLDPETLREELRKRSD